MLTRTDLRGSTPTLSQLRRALPRGGTDVNAVLPTVTPVVEAVAEHGATAALDYTEKFDRVRPASVRVPAEVIAKARADLDGAVADALEESIRRARLVHADQRRQTSVTQVVPGGTVAEKWIPVRRVGLYVPGGNAVYPSSVIMNVVPAQEAGVGSLVVASPAQADFGGWPHPTILAACALLGVDEVWAVGGAQGIALLAYGGDDTDGRVLDPVDLITGPGNIYVTAAKRLVRGVVGIDSEAGPTEIAILADDSADPAVVASDLISQAEHDVLAAAVLVTDSEALADAVDEAVELAASATKHSERVKTALAGPQSGVVLVDDIDAGLAVVDAYAAEHLEIQTRDAQAVADRVTSAGAIFVGTYSPVSLGDYSAGSNHVLPTSGSAKYASGLSVQTFLRGVHVIDYDRDALAEIADRVVTLANAEDLPAHGEAVQARFGGAR
ncbi:MULTISPECIES: histidinol dehydrogenase [Gordonia]|uniref:Histidinol dehydrogenase n=2 Tax=Gordonia TaxID=2053 RepID=L7LIZ4_9ACTN|nr:MULTISPECIES: histidinol dehydrogenase [Gordonia]AUH68807.1 histidinol dehydrogenase [Gordonia sp. YC-JH1]KXT56248.1 histidinol dehydrogenase [Gordonia sp. QH-12]MBY4570537.1 histidinol dehydrogenase [Gordonia sihwensis]GAC60057.1 histidinol dehydrogenase [Gordonia sihwensis NBRC 108236]